MRISSFPLIAILFSTAVLTLPVGYRSKEQELVARRPQPPPGPVPPTPPTPPPTPPPPPPGPPPPQPPPPPGPPPPVPPPPPAPPPPPPPQPPTPPPTPPPPPPPPPAPAPKPAPAPAPKPKPKPAPKPKPKPAPVPVVKSRPPSRAKSLATGKSQGVVKTTPSANRGTGRKTAVSRSGNIRSGQGKAPVAKSNTRSNTVKTKPVRARAGRLKRRHELVDEDDLIRRGIWSRSEGEIEELD